MDQLFALVRKYRLHLVTAAGIVILYTLGGFFLAPWLLEEKAVESVRSQFDVKLSFEDIAINPFVMSLAIDGLELDDPAGEPFLTIDRIFINFQASSLFRWAWTFREFYIEGPEVFVERGQDGDFSFDFLQTKSADVEPPPEASAESAIPRLLIADFAISNSVIRWSDLVPAEPVVTEFGPVNVAIAELNTLPDRSGQQDVVITTETQGTLSWNGALRLNPLFSEGRAAIKGSHFPLASSYLKHEAGFDLVGGEADVELDYRVAARDDGTIAASISNFELVFSDVSIRTFNAAFGRGGEDREVLRLPRLRLDGGEMRWPDRVVSARSLSIDDAVVRLFRDADGTLNVVPPSGDEAPALPVDEETGAESTADKPWQISLDRFAINRLGLGLEDRSVSPAADIGWRSLDVEVLEISNAPTQRFPVSVAIEALEGGTISSTGTVTALPQFEANLDLLVNNLALAGAHPYLKPLADVNLDSGALNVDASVSSSPAEPLHFEGSVAIADFLITETDEGSRLGSWESLSADRLVFSAAQSALEVSEVRVLRPYGDILIAEDGSVNLGRVQKEEPVVEATNEPEADESPDSSGIDITVGRILVEDGAADFEDRSLPLPFSVKIGELAGDLTTIATSSSEPSAVNLEGKVDEFGRVVIGGTVTPMDPSANTDLHVVFENIEMPKFSAYSIPFAGREIASGRLDLDLGYKVSNGELDGANKVVLRDFELGDSVEHPGALSLPLGLAVALLKDPDGRINIDVPVRGNVDDPEFKYGSVIAKALANLITRIVTSPFALLANLVGAEASELEYIAFEPGSPELAPPEVEKAVKIAEALSLRPGLVLGVHGVYAQELDAAALRAARFDATVESRMAAVGDDGAMFAERRREVIESLYIESGIGVEPSLALEAVRSEYTSQATDDTPETFDALAYTEALRRELIDLQPLVEADLLTLAAERASAVRQAIIAADPASAPRLAMGESEAVAAVDASIIQMQVELTISASGAQSSSGDGLPAGPISFSCDEGMTLTIGFDGPETLNLDDGIGTHVLSRVPSASGGRYVAGEIEFWEKGDSAVYVGAAGRYECAREGER